jgi:hypothetical protein
LIAWSRRIQATKREVVVLLALLGAVFVPAAQTAMGHRPGVGRRGAVGRNRTHEPLLEPAVVGLVLGEPQRDELPGPELDVCAHRPPTLHAGDLLGIEAQLQHVIRLD